jgi:hypothetical protein
MTDAVATHTLSLASSGDGFEELRGSYFECTGQCDDVQQGDVTLAALDAAHVIPMEISQLRQLLLRESALQSKLSDAPSEHDSRIGVSHSCMIPT